MYILRLFAGLSLEDASGPLTGRVAQQRRLALLALLGTAGGRPVSRDKVLGLLWPDSDEVSARHLLSDSLYVLRRALGDDAVLSSGGFLRLNPEVVRCDVQLFEEAMAREDLEEAVSLYRGSFLDGFYLGGEAEFEHWKDAQRVRIGESYARALEALAEEAESAGDFTRSVELWKRLLDYDLYNTRVVLRLMSAMAEAGDRANALQVAQQHEQLLRDELDIEPDLELAALVDLLRRPGAYGEITKVQRGPLDSDSGNRQRTTREIAGFESPKEPVVPHVSLFLALGLYAVTSVAAVAAAYLLAWQLGLPDWFVPGAIVVVIVCLPIVVATALAQNSSGTAASTGKRLGIGRGGNLTWRNATLAVVGAFALLGVAVSGYMAMRGMGIGPLGSWVAKGMIDPRDRIVLADFENRTSDSLLAIAVTEAFRIDLSQSRVIQLADRGGLAQALERMGRERDVALDCDVAREIAVREGMKAVLCGEISSVGPGYILSARLALVDSTDALAAYRETAADSAEIIPAMERLSKRVRKRAGESLRLIRRNEPLEQVTTSSLEALRLYSQGIRSEEFRRIELLEQAIAVDTAFAMAYRSLGARLRRYGEYERATEHVARAYEFRERLTPRERLYVEALYQSWIVGDMDATIATYRILVDNYPNPGAALQNLTVQYFHLRDWPQIKELNRRRLELFPNSSVARQQLFTVAMNEGRLADAERISQEWIQLHPGTRAWYLETASLAANVADYERAEELARRVVEEAGGETPASRSEARVASAHLLGDLAAVQGRLAEAEDHLRDAMRVRDEQSAAPGYLRAAIKLALIDAWYRANAPAAVRTLSVALERYPFDSIPARDRPYIELIRFYSYAGQPDRARSLLNEYEALVPRPMRPLEGYTHHRLLGVVALAEGRVDEAIEELGNRDIYRCAVCGQPPLGRAYEQAGQLDSAIAAYERFVETPENFKILDGNGAQGLRGTYWLPVVLERLGELHAERGNTGRAVDYYGKFVALWKDADSELQPRVEWARRVIEDLSTDT
jgi:DNA-binding SARP family transcriptional activator